MLDVKKLKGWSSSSTKIQLPTEAPTLCAGKHNVTDFHVMSSIFHCWKLAAKFSWMSCVNRLPLIKVWASLETSPLDVLQMLWKAEEQEKREREKLKRDEVQQKGWKRTETGPQREKLEWCMLKLQRAEYMHLQTQLHNMTPLENV